MSCVLVQHFAKLFDHHTEEIEHKINKDEGATRGRSLNDGHSHGKLVSYFEC